MKKVLILIFALVSIFPIYGQKLNSQGEKMVNRIICYRNEGKPYIEGRDCKEEYIIVFEYAEDGSFLGAVKNSVNGTLTIKKKKGQLLGYLDHTSYDASYEIKTDVHGYIVEVKLIEKCYNLDICDVRGFKYGYNGQLDKYSLVADSCFTCYYEKGGTSYGSDEKKCQSISYMENYLSIKDYHRSYSNPYALVSEENYAYGEGSNDTNINLSILPILHEPIDESAMFRGFIMISEWFPIYSKKLPSGKIDKYGRVDDYCEYAYSDGNLVGIRTPNYLYEIDYDPNFIQLNPKAKKAKKAKKESSKSQPSVRTGSSYQRTRRGTMGPRHHSSVRRR